MPVTVWFNPMTLLMAFIVGLAIAHSLWVHMIAPWLERRRRRRPFLLTGARLDRFAAQLGLRRRVEPDEELRARCQRSLGWLPPEDR